MSVIKFDSAELIYPNGFHALKNVKLDIQAGEFVAIIGRSGAGKSTLLRAVNRTIPITGGEGKVLGHDLKTMARADLKKLRSHVGFIFQQFNLVKNLTALDNVLHGRLSYVPLWRSMLGLYPTEDRRLAVEALNAVGLNEKHDARVDELSGGQQQRVAIARAIVQNPEIILADEPMASLDPKLSETVLQLLQKFNRERKMTVIVNMHVLDHARRYATRVIGMKQGRVVFDGPVSKLDAAALDEVYEGAVS